MFQNYNLVIYNNSTYSGQIVVYQGRPQSNVNPSHIFTLAWLSVGIEGREGKIINSAQFEWSIDYGFVWSRTGTLKPGVKFLAAGGAPVDSVTPPRGNQITFTKGQQQYTFTKQINGQNGHLIIDTSSTVVSNEASIGVSMSGASVFAVQAAPNLENWFIPYPSYTVAFGSYMQGEVLDTGQMSAKNPFEFDPGVTQLAFTYNEDGTWTQGAPAALGGKRVFDLAPKASRLVIPASQETSALAAPELAANGTDGHVIR